MSNDLVSNTSNAESNSTSTFTESRSASGTEETNQYIEEFIIECNKSYKSRSANSIKAKEPKKALFKQWCKDQNYHHCLVTEGRIIRFISAMLEDCDSYAQKNPDGTFIALQAAKQYIKACVDLYKSQLSDEAFHRFKDIMVYPRGYHVQDFVANVKTKCRIAAAENNDTRVESIQDSSKDVSERDSNHQGKDRDRLASSANHTMLLRGEGGIDHLISRIDHLISRIDHLISRIDHLISRIDHLISRIDHLSNNTAQLSRQLEGFQKSLNKMLNEKFDKMFHILRELLFNSSIQSPVPVAPDVPVIGQRRSRIDEETELRKRRIPETYVLSPSIVTVQDLWMEWKKGLGNGLPSVIEMNEVHKTKWRNGSREKKFYSKRLRIINEIDAIKISQNCTEDEAVNILEERKVEVGSLDKLWASFPKESRQSKRGETESSVDQ